MTEENFSIADALVEAFLPVYSDFERKQIIIYITTQIRRMKGPVSLELENISPIVHHLFVTKKELKCDIIGLCTALELVSESHVLEKCNFDHLFAVILEQRSIEMDTPDKERIVTNVNIKSIYNYIKEVLALRSYLSMAILRALVARFTVIKPRDQQWEDTEIIHIVKIAAVCCENVRLVPEIGRLLIVGLMKYGDKGIVDLLIRSIEEKIPAVHDVRMISRLLAPLSDVKPDAAGAAASTRCLIALLRTWPGLLCFGIQTGGITNLVKCLKKSPDHVIEVLRGITRITSSVNSVIDPYTGILMSTLVKNGIIDSLNPYVSNANVSSYLNDIIPYTTRGYYSADAVVNEADVASLYVIGTVNGGQEVMSLSNVLKMMTLRPKSWNWAQLLVLFSSMLPNNPDEAKSSEAKSVCINMLNWFSSDEFVSNKHGSCAVMGEPLYAMIKLLLKSQDGRKLIKEHKGFGKALVKAVKDVTINNSLLEKNSSRWVLFKSIVIFNCDNEGLILSSDMKSDDNSANLPFLMVELFRTCTSSNFCEAILDVIGHKDISENIMNWLMFLLKESGSYVHSKLIEGLQKKRMQANDAAKDIIDRVLKVHIRDQSDKDIDKLVRSLNFLGQIMATDPKAKARIATHPDDEPIRKIVKQYSHHISSLFFAEEGVGDVDEEITWWMTIGNLQYVSIYDKAVKYAFRDDDEPSSQMSIFDISGTTCVPPHLFGQLSKTLSGVEKLVPHVTTLISSLSTVKDLSEIRSIFFALGHFCSSPLADLYTQKYRITEKLFDITTAHSSYELKGTLIAVLSLFNRSKHFASVLESHDWHIFKFASHHSVVPREITQWLGEYKCTPASLPSVLPPSVGYRELCENLGKLANPIFTRKAQEDLREAREMAHGGLRDPEIALYGYRLVAAYQFDVVSRRYMFSLFHSTPLAKNPARSSVDTPVTARTSAQITAAILNLTRNGGVPILSLEQLRSLKMPPRCPEQFLSQEDLQTVTGQENLVAFYKMGNALQKLARKKILGQ